MAALLGGSRMSAARGRGPGCQWPRERGEDARLLGLGHGLLGCGGKESQRGGGRDWAVGSQWAAGADF